MNRITKDPKALVDRRVFEEPDLSRFVDKMAKRVTHALTLADFETRYSTAKPGSSEAALLKRAQAILNIPAEPTRRPARAELQVAAFRDTEDKVANLRTTLDQYLVGQEKLKADVLGLYEKSLNPRPDRGEMPLPIVVCGPPRTGMSTLFRALCAAINGDPDKGVVVDLSRIKSPADIDTYLYGRSAPGPIGFPEYWDEVSTSPLAPNRIQAMFEDKRPLILFDGLQALGVEAGHRFLKEAVQLLGTGSLRFPNGDVVDLSDAILMFSSTIGNDTAHGLSGEPLRRHLIRSTMYTVGPVVSSRVQTSGIFTATDPLTPEQREEIALRSRR